MPPKLRETPPAVARLNEFVRINWTSYGCDGVRIVQTGETEAMTLAAASALALLLTEAVEAAQREQMESIVEMKRA